MLPPKPYGGLPGIAGAQPVAPQPNVQPGMGQPMPGGQPGQPQEQPQQQKVDPWAAVFSEFYIEAERKAGFKDGTK